MTDILDAYAHVALPRFLSGEEMLRVMDAHRVAKTLICTAPTCPDVIELSKSIRNHPDRFLAAGLPMGRDKKEILEGVEAQLDSGFVGLRVMEDSLMEHPEILESLGRHGSALFLIGGGGFVRSATSLLGFLGDFPGSAIFAPHFAGGGEPSILKLIPVVSKLFSHPRFFVIFSLHGAFDPIQLKPWAQALVAQLGWDRILFGSEFPVPLYRNESFASTMTWADRAGIALGLKERLAFLHGNAERLLFNRRPNTSMLNSKWQMTNLKESSAVKLFPEKPMELSEEANRKVLEAYLAKDPSANSSYRDFVQRSPLPRGEG